MLRAPPCSAISTFSGAAAPGFCPAAAGGLARASAEQAISYPLVLRLLLAKT